MTDVSADEGTPGENERAQAGSLRRVPRFHVGRSSSGKGDGGDHDGGGGDTGERASDSTLVVGDEFALSRETSRHLTSVLRASPGDALCLFDGDGHDYHAELLDAGRAARVRVLSRAANPNDSPLRVTLVQGVSRGDRMDATVRQAVELGVAHIVPVRTRRSAVKLDAGRAAKRHAHWQGIVVSACEQSGRARLPVLAPLVDLADWLAGFDPRASDGCVLVPGAERRLVDVPHAPERDIAILIGPESGLDEAEIAAALGVGLQPASLGPRILRTETAGPAALAVLQARHGDL